MIKCPYCGSGNVEFQYTEPTYADWWKCKKCGKEFPGDQERYDKFMEWAGRQLKRGS